MYQRVKPSWGKHIDFMILDLLCVQLAYILSYTIYIGPALVYTVPIYYRTAIIICFIQLIVGFFTENYSDILKRGYLKELKATVKITTIVLGGILGYLFITKQSAEISRAVIVIMWLINTIMTYSARCLWKWFLHSHKPKSIKYARSILVIATKERMPALIRTLQENNYSNCVITGCMFLDDDTVGEIVEGVQSVADWDSMKTYIIGNVVDEVFVDGSKDSPEYGEKIEKLMDMLVAAGITVHYNLVCVPFTACEAKTEDFCGYTVLTNTIKIATWRQVIIKRCIDIIGGLIGCLLCGVLFLIVAPIIKIQSPGPVLFSQTRVGKNGRKFKIYKFRSMYVDAEERKAELMSQNKMDGFMFKMDNDPRIFPFGKFLRKTSIDEFPQFYNVLKGDMSLVGTRPPTVDEVEQYNIRHKKRLANKPGITGMWQISGRSDITDFEEVVKLDNEYLTSWSLGLDIKILFKTVIMVLKREGSV